MAAPSLSGFGWFITNIMGIDPLFLPPNAPVIGYSFQIAKDTTNLALVGLGDLYTQAVYNLAGDILLNFAQDQPGRTFFAEAREGYGLDKFSPGMIASTADSSSSASFLNPEFMKMLTLGDLQNMKTPYGRMYLTIAQSYGPSVVGIS